MVRQLPFKPFPDRWPFRWEYAEINTVSQPPVPDHHVVAQNPLFNGTNPGQGAANSNAGDTPGGQGIDNPGGLGGNGPGNGQGNGNGPGNGNGNGRGGGNN